VPLNVAVPRIACGRVCAGRHRRPRQDRPEARLIGADRPCRPQRDVRWHRERDQAQTRRGV